MNMYLAALLQQYRQRGVLLDTNILLLYFVGTLDPQLIPQFKRTKTFAIEDFVTLQALLQHVETYVTTPNILTEVSNLAGQLSGKWRDDYFNIFAQSLTLLDEQYVRSRDIAATSAFQRFGITDAGIIHVAQGKYLTITDDFPLSQYLRSQGADVLNFNEIRPYNWS